MTGEDYEARKDEHRPDWPGYVQHEDDLHYRDGYEAGLSAARDAVDALPCGQPGSSNRFWRDGALAAIDALRGDA